VGISGFDEEFLSPLQAYAYANKDIWADLPVVGTDAAGATDYYPEEIISVHPDVILCTYTKELADEIQSKTGVPVIAVPMGTLFGKDYEQALLLLGDVCGAKERAEEVVNYTNKCLDDLKSRTADVPDLDKPTVLGAAATFKGAHGIEGVYINYPVFKIIAANDVTRDVSENTSAVLVDKEQVLVWDPKIIFFDFSGLSLVNTDYKENTDFYTQLTAVQNGDLYQYPNSTYYYSNVEIPIVNSYYVATIIYPEQFMDTVFEEKANEIFEFFLDDDVYLSKLEVFGAGYDKVSLGDD
jgi:iron complex transport system substrate-binding protein